MLTESSEGALADCVLCSGALLKRAFALVVRKDCFRAVVGGEKLCSLGVC